MKNLESRIILLVSSIAYFIGNGIGSIGENLEIYQSGLALIGFICLIFGVISFVREKSAEKK